MGEVEITPPLAGYKAWMQTFSSAAADRGFIKIDASEHIIIEIVIYISNMKSYEYC